MAVVSEYPMSTLLSGRITGQIACKSLRVQALFDATFASLEREVREYREYLTELV